MQLRRASGNTWKVGHATGDMEEKGGGPPRRVGSGLKKDKVVKTRRWRRVGESPEPTPGR